MTEDAEARRIVDAYCRAQDYTLITREQATRFERITNGPGVVLWDEHRRALASTDADLRTALARVAELEAENERLRAVQRLLTTPVRTSTNTKHASPRLVDLDATPAATTAEQEAAFTELVQPGQEIKRDAPARTAASAPVGDGVADDTAAVQAYRDRHGGVPKGVYRLTTAEGESGAGS